MQKNVNVGIETSLVAATINSGNGTTNIDSYVVACKCDDATDSFECNEVALVPNSDFFCMHQVKLP